MSVKQAVNVVDQLTDAEDGTNLCVILRNGPAGLETLLVADEKGRWSIPGGHRKKSENRAEAVVREVKEETGLDVEVTPMLLAQHAARKIPANLYYAVCTDPGAAIRPGGGDVTEVRWQPLSTLGTLNGTDRLAIHLAAQRVLNYDALLEDDVEQGEQSGYALHHITAPPSRVPGVHVRLTGPDSAAGLRWLQQRLETLGWPVKVISPALYESTHDALERARKRRQLTPMLETLLHIADALWRYEDQIAPALQNQAVVLDSQTEISPGRLLQRGMPADRLEHALARIPQPSFTCPISRPLHPAFLEGVIDSIGKLRPTVIKA